MSICIWKINISIILLVYIPSILSLNKLHFTLSSNKQIIIQIGLGTPQQYFKVMVDTSSSYLCIFNKGSKGKPYLTTKEFNRKESVTYKDKEQNTTIKYLSSQVKVRESIDEITLNNNTKVPIAFGLITEAKEFQSTLPPEADGILGLGFNYEDTPGLIESSLLYQLVLKEKASKSTIQIEYIEKQSGYITLGKNIDISAVSQWGSCSPTRTGVDQDYTRWVCNSDFIELGVISQKGNEIIRNEKSELFKFIFDTSINHLLLPGSIFKTIQDKVFNSFSPSDCIIKKAEIYNEIVCKSSINKSNIKPINIVFTGEEVMIIDSRNAFIERVSHNGLDDEKEYVFVIKSLQSTHPYSDLLIIGQPLLQAFSVIFHKNNEKIYFFSSEFYKSLSIRTWIFIVLGIIAIAVIVVLVLSWYLFKYFMKKHLIKLDQETLRISQASNDLLTHFNYDDDSENGVIKEVEGEDKSDDENIDKDGNYIRSLNIDKSSNKSNENDNKEDKSSLVIS